jgi:predicted TIM-barrel enzyme
MLTLTERRDSILTRFEGILASGGWIQCGFQTAVDRFEPAIADLVFVHHTASFGKTDPAWGLLPFVDANQILLDLAPGLERGAETCFVAGVCATDPFRMPARFLDELERAGYCGVQNFPSVSVIDGSFREHLETAGMGFSREVEFIRLAGQRGFLAVGLARVGAEAAALAEAGADLLVIVARRGHEEMTARALERSILERVRECINAASSGNRKPFFIIQAPGISEETISRMRPGFPRLVGFIELPVRPSGFKPQTP